ncbi:MFS transporter [Gorillibacterium sp. CAU 1737]|uniref:MFS transporter n=1 Tax=Gorillibacterium sp. CAU 1737 TaxID=3140362 RepID=UPI003260D7AF
MESQARAEEREKEEKMEERNEPMLEETLVLPHVEEQASSDEAHSDSTGEAQNQTTSEDAMPNREEEEEQTGKKTLLQLLRNRSYLTLLMASVISRFGDSLDSIAYSWMVYELTGSKALMGLLFGVNALPNLLVGPFAGVLVDRWPNKPILVISDFVRGSVVCVAALLFFTGHLAAWHLFVFTIIQSTMEALCVPAEKTLIPELVPHKQLLSANSYLSTASRLAELGGLGAAGILIATLGITGAILIDSFTFLISGLILLFGLTRMPAKPQASEKLTPRRYMMMMKEGFVFIHRNKLLFAAVITAAFINFCLTPFNVLLPAFSKDLLNSGPAGLSYMSGALTVGMIIGGIWVGARGSRYSNSALISTALALIGAMYALFSLTIILPDGVNLIGAVAACFVMGMSIPLASSPLMTLLQQKTPREIMGRIMALMSMLMCAMMPIGGWFTAGLSEVVSVPALFVIMGLMVVLAAALFRRRTKAF